MLTSSLLLILGLGLLVWSADKFTYGAAAIARNFGIPPLIVGLTIIAMGSSAPEMMVAATASLAGKPDTAVGNAIGSNITNITLVLGLTALFRPMLVSSTTLRRELPMVFITSAIAGILLWDAELAFFEGAMLLLGFFCTIGGLTWIAIKRPNEKDPMAEEMEADVPANVPTYLALFWLIAGLVVLIYSSDLLVENAVVIAKFFGISDLVIGLTIIAIGTSLPELAACISSVLKKEDDLALGNIIGSNIFNILAVLAIPGLLAPGAIDPSAAGRDFYYMMGVTLLLLIVAGNGRIKTITRAEGGLLLACFIAYQLLLFFSIG